VEYYDRKDFEKSLQNSFKSLEFYNKLPKKESETERAKLYSQIGLVYKTQKTFDKALQYYVMALDIKESSGMNYEDKVPTYESIGEVYDKKGEPNKAIEYYTKCINVLKSLHGDKHPKVISLSTRIFELRPQIKPQAKPATQQQQSKPATNNTQQQQARPNPQPQQNYQQHRPNTQQAQAKPNNTGANIQSHVQAESQLNYDLFANYLFNGKGPNLGTQQSQPQYNHPQQSQYQISSNQNSSSKKSQDDFSKWKDLLNM